MDIYFPINTQPLPDWMQYYYIFIIIPILFIQAYFYIYGYPISSVSGRTRRNIHRILFQQSSYYNTLIESEKKRFAKRVIHFLRYKEFKPLKGFAINDDMKVAIAASAIQITFGYDDTDEYDYKSFNRIILFPQDYLSKKTNKMHKGETGRNGESNYVALSWESFKKENINTQDGINVGLHEFAHALYVNNVEGNTTDEFIDSINEWYDTIIEVAAKQETHEFLRRYAFVNRMEFFAVSMEYFFENPQGFNTHIPELYSLMTVILNQNPLKFNNGIERS